MLSLRARDQNGFGFRLKLAPFPGESYQQLIAAEPLL